MHRRRALAFAALLTSLVTCTGCALDPALMQRISGLEAQWQTATTPEERDALKAELNQVKQDALDGNSIDWSEMLMGTGVVAAAVLSRGLPTAGPAGMILRLTGSLLGAFIRRKRKSDLPPCPPATGPVA